MPTDVRMDVPFLGGGPSISEQILEGLRQGFEEKAQRQQLGIEQQNANTNQQRAASDVSLQGAQTDEIRERMRQHQVLLSMFQPKPDFAAPGAQPTNQAAPRSDFDRIVDNADIPDGLKDTIKFNGRTQAQAGKPEQAFVFLDKVLSTFGKNVKPHPILNEAGMPIALVDRFGEPFELHDPNMPPELQPLATAALNAYNAKNLLAPGDVANTNTQNNRRWQVLHPGQALPSDLTLSPGASKDDAARADKHLNELLQLEGVRAARDAANTAKNTGRADESYKFNTEELNKLENPISATAQRVGRLKDTLNQKNPQADALVAPELLSIMAGGAGSGLRMNEAEIARIVGGRSAWQNLQATIQHWNTDPTAARSITPEQDTQIRDLVQAVDSKLTEKQTALQAARSTLLNSDDPKVHRQAVNAAREKLLQVDTGAASQPSGGFSPDNPFAPKKGPQ